MDLKCIFQMSQGAVWRVLKSKTIRSPSVNQVYLHHLSDHHTESHITLPIACKLYVQYTDTCILPSVRYSCRYGQLYRMNRRKALQHSWALAVSVSPHLPVVTVAVVL